MVTVERPGKNEEDVSDTVSITIEYVRFLIASVLSYDQQAALAGPSTSGEKELEGEHGINVQMYLQDSRFEDVETERDLYYQKIEYASLYNSSSQPVNKSLIQYTERQVQGRWPVIETYGYDQSHRLESFQATDAFYSGATLYSSYQRASASYSYDDLGRFETLQRNGYINSNTPSKLTFDNLSYSYGSSASLAPTEVSDASQHYHGRSTNSSYTGANNELHYNSAGDISSDENKNVKYEYNALGLVSKHLKWSPSTGQAEISYRYSADGQLIESIEKDFQGIIVSKIYHRDGQRYDSQDGSVYVSHEVGAVRIMPDGSSHRIYYQNDHLGNVMLAWSDLNGNGVIEASSELLEESAYFPYGLKRQEYRTQTEDVPFSYNGAEENSDWRLHLTTYRTMAPELALWGQVDPKAEWDYGTSPYTAMRGNPISYADPDGDFITWSVHGGGFSLGVNFTPIGLTFGGGLNFGFRGGFSLGAYGEVGPRIGGDGFGAGATVSQSFDYNFKQGQGTSTTSIGAYGSAGPFNGGVNGAVSYGAGRTPVYSWGVSAGVGVGNEKGGVGLFVGYGSGGFNAGIGGYYDPRADVSATTNFVLGDGAEDEFTERVSAAGPGNTFEESDAISFRGNSKVEPGFEDGKFTYSMDLPKNSTYTGGVMMMEGIFGEQPRYTQNGRKLTISSARQISSANLYTTKLHSGNQFNFKNFNTYNYNSRGRTSLTYSNLFGYTWFR